MTAEVLSMGVIRNDADCASPRSMLLAAASEYETGKLTGSKCLVIYVRDEDGGYGLGYRNAGMTHPEMLAALEYAKAFVIEQMNGR